MEIINAQTGAGREGLPKNKMDNILIPIPSEKEQKNIVQKVEILMQKVTALEEEIKKSEANAQMLMQAVLKEAFEPKEEKLKIFKINSKPINVDYYKRTLLATEIVWQLHKQPTLGHLKLQKLIYLSQEVSKMKLPTNFLKQVAGPYDNQMARSIDKQLKEKKWFEYKKEELLKYKPLEKAGEHRKDFDKYFSEENESIQYILDLFKIVRSEKLEIVATLYACWKNIIENKEVLSNKLLVKRFYEWSEEKAKFKEERLFKAIDWMNKKGIVPV